jgi:phage terminase large subunit-like protein
MHKAEQYAADVKAGKIITGDLIKKAVGRYYYDLQTGIDRGLYFNRPLAEKKCAFFHKVLKHSKGKWHGKPFELDGWQAFIIWNLFGWFRADGRRRFNSAYIQVARKNGKTTLAAGIGLEMMVADGEQGADIFVGATKLSQAYITFNEARSMVSASEALSSLLTVYRHNIHSEQLNAKFEPLSSDGDKQDGLSPHCGIIDEYHAHKTDELFNVIESGMGARTNPLMFVITTAGFNKNGPCYAMRDLCIKILNKVIVQDDIFTLIYEMDNETEWENPANWIKANPSMHSIDTILPFLQSRFEKVKNDPTKYVDFMTKNLNRWMDSSEVWIEDDRWMQCDGPVTLDMLRGLTCYGALDLSTREDITALTIIADDNGTKLLLPFFFVPEDNAKKRAAKDGVPYDTWIRQGHIIATPGDQVDYTAIRRLITGYYVEDNIVKHDSSCLMDALHIVRIGFDKWNSSQLVNDLMFDGMEMVEFRQGFGSMSAPTKEFKSMVYKRQFAHGGNPVLRWMISNVEIKRDPAGNVKPDKEKSADRIDGVVSSIMALGEYLADNAAYMGDIYEVRTV